jgi:hypothetical protein
MSLALYTSSIILLVVIATFLAFSDNLNVYGGAYSLGVPLGLMSVLVVVFFSKVGAHVC